MRPVFDSVAAAPPRLEAGPSGESQGHSSSCHTTAAILDRPRRAYVTGRPRLPLYGCGYVQEHDKRFEVST